MSQKVSRDYIKVYEENNVHLQGNVMKNILFWGPFWIFHFLETQS